MPANAMTVQSSTRRTTTSGASTHASIRWKFISRWSATTANTYCWSGFWGSISDVATDVYAPLNSVSPYTTFSGMPLFYSSTNGLASRNTRVDALCHALCEVVERDASALAMASSQTRSCGDPVGYRGVSSALAPLCLQPLLQRWQSQSEADRALIIVLGHSIGLRS